MNNASNEQSYICRPTALLVLTNVVVPFVLSNVLRSVEHFVANRRSDQSISDTSFSLTPDNNPKSGFVAWRNSSNPSTRPATFK